MKEWEVIFADQKGEQKSLVIESDHCPSDEEAAHALRSHLFPVTDELNLNDLENRVPSAAARWLKEHHSVAITGISERS